MTDSTLGEVLEGVHRIDERLGEMDDYVPNPP